jgi:hypothetical protein
MENFIDINKQFIIRGVYRVSTSRGTLYPQKLALNSQTRGGRSVGIVRSQTQDSEFVCFCFYRVLTFSGFEIVLSGVYKIHSSRFIRMGIGQRD